MRGRLARVLAVLVLAATTMSMSGASADSLGPNAFTLAGFGTVSPGYAPTQCFDQTSFVFDSIVSVDAGDDAGAYAAHYEAASAGCETLAVGQGLGNLSTVNLIGVQQPGGGPVDYFRFGTSLELSGTVVLKGHAHNILAAECAFWYTDANPSTSYQIDCAGVLA